MHLPTRVCIATLADMFTEKVVYHPYISLGFDEYEILYSKLAGIIKSRVA